MAVIVKLESGNWRVQIRYKRRYASQTFKRKCDADAWAKQTETDIDQGKAPSLRVRTEAKTFGDLIDLHLDDLSEAGQPLRRSKDHVLRRLKEDIGETPLADLTKPELIALGAGAQRKTRAPPRSPSISRSSARS